MLTCRTLRGTSWRWMKARKCLWIGIKPNGEGDLLNSCQLHVPVEPFDAGDSSEWSWASGAPLDTWRPSAGFFLWRTGERDFGRGFRPVAMSIDSSDEDVSPSPSARTSCPFACFCALDLVVGAVYSDLDSGAGLGEVTLGVAGIVLCDISNVKVGSAQVGTSPRIVLRNGLESKVLVMYIQSSSSVVSSVSTRTGLLVPSTCSVVGAPVGCGRQTSARSASSASTLLYSIAALEATMEVWA